MKYIFALFFLPLQLKAAIENDFNVPGFECRERVRAFSPICTDRGQVAEFLVRVSPTNQGEGEFEITKRILGCSYSAIYKSSGRVVRLSDGLKTTKNPSYRVILNLYKTDEELSYTRGERGVRPATTTGLTLHVRAKDKVGGIGEYFSGSAMWTALVCKEIQ